MNIPTPTIIRLCQIHRMLDQCERAGKKRVSSTQIGTELGIGAHNVRKDINYLGEVGESGAGYGIVKLKACIEEQLGIDKKKKVCVVGLGNLGMALIEHAAKNREYDIVAGFDSSINRLETVQTSMPVYPSSDIREIVAAKGIELAMIAVPVPAAQEIADRLIAAGIKGILNFAPTTIISNRKDVIVRNVDVDGEVRILSAMIRASNERLDSSRELNKEHRVE